MADVPQRWDLEVDFVAIGSGIGGLTGALVAHDEGLQVAILEKTDKVGGVTALSGGQVWVGNNHLEREMGIEDSEAEARAYLTFLGGGEYVEENLQAFISNAPIALEYLVERAGLRLKVQESVDYYYPRAPGSLLKGRTLEEELFAGPSLGEWQERTRTSPHFLPGITAGELAAGKGTDRELLERRAAEDWRAGGAALAAYLVKAALVDRGGIACFTGTPARELVSQGGEVVGVRAERERMDFWLRARRGVLIATSGYDHDARMASAFERAPEWHSTTFPGLTGDGLTMAAELGGAVTASSPDQVLLSIHVPGETNEGAPLYRIAIGAGMPHAILVNRGGRRFADESFYRSVAKAVREYDAVLQSFKNFPCFLICDQDHRDQFPIVLGGLFPGQPLPEGLGAQADSLRELAGMLDIDAVGLEETVVRFNEFARAGKDRDFHREERPSPGKLAPIERPPYYGVPLTLAGVGVNNAGLMTDGDARVLRNRGDAIPGLYAAGNAAAHLEARRGYQSGIANARGMTYGYLAAKHAAKEPVREP